MTNLYMDTIRILAKGEFTPELIAEFEASTKTKCVKTQKLKRVVRAGYFKVPINTDDEISKAGCVFLKDSRIASVAYTPTSPEEIEQYFAERTIPIDFSRPENVSLAAEYIGKTANQGADSNGFDFSYDQLASELFEKSGRRAFGAHVTDEPTLTEYQRTGGIYIRLKPDTRTIEQIWWSIPLS